MNTPTRSEQAARWFILCRDEPILAEAQRQALVRWLRCSKENLAAYLKIAELHARIERPLARRSPEPGSATIVKLFDQLPPHVSPRAVTPAVERAPTPALISRRGTIQKLAAGLSGFAIIAAVTSAMKTSRPDVIATGHVSRVWLRGGVMHAARHTIFQIDDPARTVHLLSGQAAFHCWEAVRAVAQIKTPFGTIVGTAARLGVLVLKSMLVVTVVEGRVRVLSLDGHSPEVVISAGQKLTFGPGVLRAPAIAVANPERELAWTQGDLYFDGETIAEAASVFNRFNQLRIEPSPDIAHLSVSSHRCALNDPQRFADRFTAEWDLRSRRDDTGHVIHIFKSAVASGGGHARNTL